MARKMTEWPSKCGPITKIMQSDGCKRDTVPVAVGQWYNFYEFGCHLGNVDSTASTRSSHPLKLTLAIDGSTMKTRHDL